MPFNIGISSSNTCVNIECGKELTDFEKNRQNQFSCRYFFCIKCRNKGIPKFGEFVKVKCVHCSTIKRLNGLGESLMCKDCLASRRRKREQARNKRYYQEKIRKNELQNV
tara:strand:- start:3320 stop:3649 length:330 start_codon:yes stop_codon:yes gene_type:complete